MSDYFKEFVCPVCSLPKGWGGPNHAECSKILQKTKPPRKANPGNRYTERRIDEFLKHLDNRLLPDEL